MGRYGAGDADMGVAKLSRELLVICIGEIRAGVGMSGEGLWLGAGAVGISLQNLPTSRGLGWQVMVPPRDIPQVWQACKWTSAVRSFVEVSDVDTFRKVCQVPMGEVRAASGDKDKLPGSTCGMVKQRVGIADQYTRMSAVCHSPPSFIVQGRILWGRAVCGGANKWECKYIYWNGSHKW